MKKGTVEVNSTVVGVNRGAVAVELANGSVVRGIIAGRLMRHRIRVVAGDKVQVQISPYDLGKGRIVWRAK